MKELEAVRERLFAAHEKEKQKERDKQARERKVVTDFIQWVQEVAVAAKVKVTASDPGFQSAEISVQDGRDQHDSRRYRLHAAEESGGMVVRLTVGNDYRPEAMGLNEIKTHLLQEIVRQEIRQAERIASQMDGKHGPY